MNTSYHARGVCQPCYQFNFTEAVLVSICDAVVIVFIPVAVFLMKMTGIVIGDVKGDIKVAGTSGTSFS